MWGGWSVRITVASLAPTALRTLALYALWKSSHVGEGSTHVRMDPTFTFPGLAIERSSRPHSPSC